ncbi:hypothetical protein E0485_06700 [Paenibacillus albiflavus]|uniref:Uncharacterized protein n=1 Tax=Paenibacillus albiflavus TaxID=2545760 RepID=A0A4V2WPC1_9BACL|nr:hypothetical protein [Paenibacillus albiflavus]TCZ78762.1 hypothetical protein E0485_06700 [Paenibacillus albiflavus]
MVNSREEEVNRALEAEFAQANATNAYSTGLTLSGYSGSGAAASALDGELDAMFNKMDSVEEEI